MKSVLLNCCCSVPPQAQPLSEDDLAQQFNDEGRANSVSPSALPNTMKPSHEASNGKQEPPTAKMRVQEMVREFAHASVGPGFFIQMQQGQHEPESCLLRMDRHLRCIEFWPPVPVTQGAPTSVAAQLCLPLSEVARIDRSATDVCALILKRSAGKSDVVVNFDSAAVRDKSHTCLRVFLMSVEHEGAMSQAS